jgi:hypothetical protein
MTKATTKEAIITLRLGVITTSFWFGLAAACLTAERAVSGVGRERPDYAGYLSVLAYLHRFIADCSLACIFARFKRMHVVKVGKFRVGGPGAAFGFSHGFSPQGCLQGFTSLKV